MTALQDQDCVCVCVWRESVPCGKGIQHQHQSAKQSCPRRVASVRTQLCDISGQYLMQNCPVISAQEYRGLGRKEVCKNYTSSITTNYRQLLRCTVLVTLSTKMLPNFVTRHFDYRLLREYLILDSSHQHPGLSWYVLYM